MQNIELTIPESPRNPLYAMLSPNLDTQSWQDLDFVCKLFGYNKTQIQSKSRHSEIIYKRHALIYFFHKVLNQRLNIPLKKIALMIYGKPEHGSIIHNSRKFKELVESKHPEALNEYAKILPFLATNEQIIY